MTSRYQRRENFAFYWFAPDPLFLDLVGEAKYKVEFEGMWTLKNHPLGYPGDGPSGGAAHFSPLTGATFPYGSEFFKAGGMASGGIEAIAESGNPTMLIDALGEDTMTYMSVTRADGGAYNPWRMMIEVTADEMHDHLGLATMIAPSPDWFTGASMIDLCDYETGEWKKEVTHMAMAYDAGTEMGTGFSGDNEAEDPHMPISMIMCDGMAFCEAGEDIKPVAKITVTMM